MTQDQVPILFISAASVMMVVPFIDYLKIGLPLMLMMFVVTMLLMPICWPL
ncbi:MAG: hypothetical protein IBX48_02825 [Thiomicrospira sp.]|uniref:hypothetical protein n=1 Tax=Thiomicrospira sp. TaxID=935 RepID=UPI0019F8530F|nr:hypothetical protein [Thiomicrospira sp.]MBE0493252.1 hypothetical protein [Thiomicrospira sp.]